MFAAFHTSGLLKQVDSGNFGDANSAGPPNWARKF
jgi:hypothetical protein